MTSFFQVIVETKFLKDLISSLEHFGQMLQTVSCCSPLKGKLLGLTNECDRIDVQRRHSGQIEGLLGFLIAGNIMHKAYKRGEGMASPKS